MPHLLSEEISVSRESKKNGNSPGIVLILAKVLFALTLTKKFYKIIAFFYKLDPVFYKAYPLMQVMKVGM